MPEPKTFDELLTQIAIEHIPGLTTLESRNSDEFDFHDVSVWTIKAALSQAYQIGYEQGVEAGKHEANKGDNER